MNKDVLSLIMIVAKYVLFSINVPNWQQIVDNSWSSSSLTDKGSGVEISVNDNSATAFSIDKYRSGRLWRHKSYILLPNSILPQNVFTNSAGRIPLSGISIPFLTKKYATKMEIILHALLPLRPLKVH